MASNKATFHRRDLLLLNLLLADDERAVRDAARADSRAITGMPGF